MRTNVLLVTMLAVTFAGRARADNKATCNDENAALTARIASTPAFADEERAVAAAPKASRGTQPIGPATQHVLDESDAFLRTAKCPAEIAHARFVIAQIHLSRGRAATAIPVLTKLLDTYPNSDKSADAWKSLQSALIETKRLGELATLTERYCATRGLRAIVNTSKASGGEGACDALDEDHDGNDRSRPSRESRAH